MNRMQKREVYLVVSVLLILAATAVATNVNPTGKYVYKTGLNTELLEGGGIALLNKQATSSMFEGVFKAENYYRPKNAQENTILRFSFAAHPTCPRKLTFNPFDRELFECEIIIDPKINYDLARSYALAKEGQNIRLTHLKGQGTYTITPNTKVELL